jgi:hypothetical protein
MPYDRSAYGAACAISRRCPWEHRVVLLAFVVLAAVLALAAIGSLAPAADPPATSAKSDGPEKLELEVHKMRVSLVAKVPESVASSVSENDTSSDSGPTKATARLEPLSLSVITVPSLMVMANFSSVVAAGQAETPTRAAADPCAATPKSQPEKPTRVVRATMPKSTPKPAAPAPQVRSSWLRPSWLRLSWSSARVEADTN